MSSPLSSLKKVKRTPLQQGEISDTHHRSLLRGNSPNNISIVQKEGPRRPGLVPPVKQQSPSLEERVIDQAKEIRHRDMKIAALEEALRVNKEVFERKYSALKRQVFEMESFLKDYNMIWVGSESSVAEESGPIYCSNGLWTPPENSEQRAFCINFDLVLDKIQELNYLSGKGETFVQATSTGAQLAQRRPVELWLYQNGMTVSGGPFQTYQEQKSRQFLQDLMDGYFPSELQERFPDGVPFEVHDRRAAQFIHKPQKQTFPGVGYVIQGDHGQASSSMRAAGCHGQTLSSGAVETGPSIEAASETAPPVTQGSSGVYSRSSLIHVNTEASLAAEKESLQVNPEFPGSKDGVTSLKIKSEDGSCTFILRLTFFETIGHIRQYLDKHRGDRSCYDILSLHPPRCYDDNSQTIRACGLTTNAALLLRKKNVSVNI